jgi:hypothetical protein
VSVLPNGSPLIISENGDLYLLISRKKLFGKQELDSSSSPEMIKLIDNAGIKFKSVAVASGMQPDASIE